MVKLNKNYDSIKETYLFANINKKLRAFIAENPDAPIIKMGIGDVTRPLTQPVVDALVKASKEMGVAETFKGYADEQGYGFLQTAVKNYYKKTTGVDLQDT